MLYKNSHLSLDTMFSVLHSSSCIIYHTTSSTNVYYSCYRMALQPLGSIHEELVKLNFIGRVQILQFWINGNGEDINIIQG